MTDVHAATPGSSTTSKPPAVKDKECQYCHQAFTSSSLGRHLDLYIKDKNAKPPDDLHDVEEIRRLRGNVTRRQARTSLGKRESSAISNSKPTPLRDERSPSLQIGNSSSHVIPPHPNAGQGGIFVNKPGWESTGVINDLPLAFDNAPYARMQSPPRKSSVKEEILHKKNILEERDRARAAELALKEVLDNVKAANARAHPPSPFDFNFFSLSFPELCLQCLSAPQSLLSSPAVPDPNTWSIDAPRVAHYEILQDWLEDKLRNWHRLRQPQFGPNHTHQSSNSNGHYKSPSNSDILADTERYKTHLATTYETWKAFPEKKKQDLWLNECAKAFTREQEQHKATKQRLDLAEQKIQLLRSQLAQAHQVAETQPYDNSSILPITRETASQLPKSDFFNYENLLSKWKSKIQTSRSAQQPLPPPPSSPWATNTTTASPTQNMNNNNHHHHHHHTNGTTTYPSLSHHPSSNHQNGTTHHSDEDEDLADAPGEEDDLSQQNAMDKVILDPTLRHAEMDGDGQLGGRMLMEMSGYTGSGAGNSGGGGGLPGIDMGR